MKRIWITFICLFFSLSIEAQSPSDSLKPLDLIDTLFIDRDLNNWSIRLLFNTRDVRFRLKNDAEDVRYIPTNRFGMGLGIASRKLILDFNIAFKLNEEAQTDMFNMLGTAVFGKHVVDAFLQDFHGFYKRDEKTGEEVFRNDASSLLMGVNYSQHLKSSKYSITSLRSGLDYQRKSVISPMVGGFFMIDRLKADSALIGFDVQRPDIVKYTGVGFGGSAGISGLLVLPLNMFAAVSVMPSAGLFVKTVTSPEGREIAANPFLFMLSSSATIGYNGDDIYVNFTIQTNRTTTELPFNMRQNLQQTNAKLAIGYKLFNRRLQQRGMGK
jgi:hypothetical protein